MKKLKLLLLLCLTFSLPTNSMQLTSLYTYLNKDNIVTIAFTIALLIGFTFLDQKNLKKIKTTADANPVNSQAVKNFILKIAQERDCNNITFFINPSGYSACSSATENFFCLSQQQADGLDKELGKTINNQDQDLLNLHSFCIHHELTHLKRKTTHKVTLTRNAGEAISTFVSFTLLKKYTPKNWNNTLPILMPLLVTGPILNYIFTLYITWRHEEIKADDGIPDQKELLKAGVKFFEKEHSAEKRLIQEIHYYHDLPDKAQNLGLLQMYAIKVLPPLFFEQSPFLRGIALDPSHPSNEFRAKRFQDRLAKIKATENNNNK